jgi:hypothetical protein
MNKMEEMYNVRNVTNHPVHLTYRKENGMPIHITLKPGEMGALPRTEMLSAVLNPFIEHKGEVVAGDTICQIEVDKMLPAVKTVAKEVKDTKDKDQQKSNKGKGPGREL